MSVAKGLAAGYLPLGAAIYTDRVAEPIMRMHGAPMTGHTFTGHTACCAAAVAVQKIVARDGLVAKVRGNEQSQKMIAEALSGVEAVGDIRGRGHFIATELVADRKTKKPFDGSLKLFMHVRQQALANGLICYPVGGNVDGINGDVIILAPPYNSSDAELTEMVDKMAKSIKQVLAAKGLASSPASTALIIRVAPVASRLCVELARPRSGRQMPGPGAIPHLPGSARRRVALSNSFRLRNGGAVRQGR